MTERQRSGDLLRTGILFLAVMTTGLTAGVFVHWSNTVMPGLGNVDDRTFVVSFQALDEAILNPLFIGVEFLGGLLLTGLAAALHLRPEQRKVLLWVGAALVCHLAVFAITVGVNVPLNEELRDAGQLNGDADFAAARAQLDEAMWSTWNAVRAVASTTAFGCLAWALAIHGRISRRSDRAKNADTASATRETSYGGSSPSGL